MTKNSRRSLAGVSKIQDHEVEALKKKRGSLIQKRSGMFTRFARKTAEATGKPMTFGLAVGIILVWGLTGPLFHFSDTWQLVINTGTTIITFLMVFLIQNTQNRDSQAVQLKLDELIRATEQAHTALIDLEQLTDAELEKIRTRYLDLAKVGRQHLRDGTSDTGTPDIDPNC